VKARTISSFIINIAIFGLVIMSTVFMMTGYEFMGEGLKLTATKVEALKFFTVDSNLLMGLIAIIFAVYQILYMTCKIEKIPTAIYVLKLTGTVGVVLTFITTACFLAPFLVDDYFSLFTNSNLFFHFVIPVMSLITFVFLEEMGAIRWRYSFIGMIPMVIYSIFYSITAISHAENGKVPFQYDWYGFVQGGLINMIFVLPVMLGGTYLIAYLLWLGNKGMWKCYNKGKIIEENA